MSENKYCGNCKHFKNEDLGGWGICVGFSKKFGVHCSHVNCLSHKTTERIANGWTEITPDNVESLKQVEEKRIVIANKHNSLTFYRCLHDINGLDSMVKQGGYYYFILPELKIE